MNIAGKLNNILTFDLLGIFDRISHLKVTPNTIYPFEVTNRRVGRPKNNWTYKTYERLAIKNTPATVSTWKDNPRLYMDMMKTSIVDRTVTV